MPPEIQKLAGSILVNPSKVEVTPASTTAETVQQSIYFVEKKDKRSLLLHVLKGQLYPHGACLHADQAWRRQGSPGLVRAGIRAEAIHGNKSQNARQRALENFKSRQTRILVATDIAARGIDIDELTHVINFELPNVPETYVHRIGRTGRAGASGTALSFCDQEEKEFLRDIQKLIARQIPVLKIIRMCMPRYLLPGSGSRHVQLPGRNGSGNGRRNGARERIGGWTGCDATMDGRQWRTGSGNGKA
jgi:ATP-dependent RNA helicase RhlE